MDIQRILQAKDEPVIISDKRNKSVMIAKLKQLVEKHSITIDERRRILNGKLDTTYVRYPEIDEDGRLNKTTYPGGARAYQEFCKITIEELKKTGDVAGEDPAAKAITPRSNATAARNSEPSHSSLSLFQSAATTMLVGAAAALRPLLATLSTRVAAAT